METVELTDKDYQNIMGIAHRNFTKDYVSRNDDSFLCKCYVSAIVEYTKNKGLMLEDGRFHKKG